MAASANCRFEFHKRRDLFICKDERGLDLISDALRFGGLWYGGPNASENAIGYAKHHSRAHDAVIRVYDAVGNVIETHEHKGDFEEPSTGLPTCSVFGQTSLYRLFCSSTAKHKSWTPKRATVRR